MTGFYFALLAVLLAGFGARDQRAVAGLSARQGARPGVLVVALLVSVMTAAFAGWGASLVAPLLVPKARMILAAMALLFAGVEALLVAPKRGPKEPTASLGALSIVLLAHQLTDAARFLIFAVAVASAAPVPSAIGGAVGGAVLLGLAWAAPAAVIHPRAALARRAVGAILVLMAAFLALRAFERI